MNIIDIIVGLLLIYALWRGWSSGILVQLGGIAGVVAGTWLAFRFSERVCIWFDIGIEYKWLTFIAILIAAMIIVIILCRALSALLSAGGLSVPIKFLGALVSAIKIVIILALIMRTFENINTKGEFTKDAYLKESISYKPLDRVATAIFPYLNSWLNDVENNNPNLEKDIEEKINKEVEKQVEKKIKDKLDNIQNNDNND